MSKIDWSDPEQVRAYRREWHRTHRAELNEKRRDARRNRPAEPGVKGRGRPETGFIDLAYCTENRYTEEICWDIDTDKLRRNREE